MYFRRDFRQADNCLSLMSFFVCKMRTNLSTLWDFLSMRNKVSERHTMFLGEDDDSFKLLLFSCLVMPDSLWPHGLQHVRLPCPSPSPRVDSNSCPLSWWCHSTVSSSVTPFSSFPQSVKSQEPFISVHWTHCFSSIWRVKKCFAWWWNYVTKR